MAAAKRPTRATQCRAASNRQAALDNPHEYAVVAVNIIKEKLAEQLVSGIRYEKDGTWYEMSQFAEEVPSWEEYIVPSEVSGAAGGTHIYSGVISDSETIEKPFILDLERRADVKLYIKLPDWFMVDTPIGRYNPDWAIVMDDPEHDGNPVLYLVRETKGTLNLNELRPEERRKILCGRAHFEGALGVSYRVVTTAAQLPAGGI